MTCAACGRDAPDMSHRFYEGTPERPSRRWVVVAPLYFKANTDNTAAVEGYCGPVCAIKTLRTTL